MSNPQPSQTLTQIRTKGKPAGWSRLSWPLLVLLGFIGIASIGYRLIEEEYTWLDAVYMTVISLSTAAHGEVGELSASGRIWTMIVIAGGLLAVAIVVSMVGGIIIEGRIRKVLGRRQVERKIASLTNHVIVCGYGRMGAEVANELTTARRNVVVIDIDPERVATADKAGLLSIRGDAQEEDVLQAARVEQAAMLAVCLREDADNLFVTLSARQAKPNIHIVARAEQEASQRKLLKAGANSVVCPQAICARRMASLILRPAVIELADMAQQGLNLEVSQLKVDDRSSLADKTLAELELPRKLGAHVVAIRRADGQAVYHPQSETRLAVGDTLLFVGDTGSSKAIDDTQRKTAP